MLTATVHVSAAVHAVMAANIFPILDEHCSLVACPNCRHGHGCDYCDGTGLVHRSRKHDLDGFYAAHDADCTCPEHD